MNDSLLNRPAAAGKRPAGRGRAWFLTVGIGALLALSASLQAEAPVRIPLAPPLDAFADAADLVPWPEKAYPRFAAGSVANVGEWLFDAPAGKHGFVRAQPDGQLAFADGTPARFWGTTTVYGMTFPEKTEEIVILAEAIAASGYNLVRFHHNDMPRAGLGFLQANPPSNSLLDPKMIDRLDRFAAELYKRGIYVYLDFVDSRDLLPEDGIEDAEGIKKVGNAGWKGLFPHPKIVEAWKRSVTELLKHKNPYTGRTWGEEPGVATIEIINENGLFWDWNFKLTEPMRKWHDTQWNLWLQARYGGRAKLDAQWTDAAGKKGLFDDEDPAANTVFAPRLGNFLDWDRPYHSKTRGAARVNDYYAFLADSATTFYRDAAQHIRSLGFKGVIVGSHELQGPINQYAEVQGTGALASHLYANSLTAWNARPTTRGAVVEGVDVKTNNWFANLPRIKVQGVPGINGEWTGGSFTRRADVNLAVAAMTSFQGVTQSLHFSYAHRWTRGPMNNFDTTYDYQQYRNAFGRTYSSVHDAPWMTVNRICAPLFIRRDFAKPRVTAHLAFSTEDRFEQNLHALGLSGGSGTIGDAAVFLPELHNVECSFFDQVYQGDADVVFMTGRTASGDYRKAKHAVLVGDNPYNDRYHKTRDLGVPARFVNPNAKIVTLDAPVTFTVSAPWDAERTLAFDRLEGAVELASIPKGAQPIGKSADGKYTLGWLDDRFLVLPNGRAFQNRIGDIQWLYRLYLVAGKRWNLDVADNAVGNTFYRSDTRELTVDWASGTLVIDTPRTQGFSGLMGWRENNATSNLTCTVDVPYANVLATSADGKSLAESRRMLLVAAGRMQNTGQELGQDKNGFANFVKTGKAPMLVEALRGKVSLASRLASGLVVYALDCEGRRLGKVETAVQDGRLSFALSPKWGSIWFEIAAPDVPGPAAPATPATVWPLAETVRTTTPPAPVLVELRQLLAVATPKAAAATPAAATVGKDPRFIGVTFASEKICRFYGNATTSVIPDPDRTQVLRGQFGKVNRDWFGGIWSALATPAGLKPGDCLGFGFSFKGDGTVPRDAFLTLKTSKGIPYKSKNLRTIFETDAWQEVILKPEDFTLDPAYVAKHPDEAKTLSAVPDWNTVNRFDFGCGGPLMDQQSVGLFSEFFFVLARAPETTTLTAAALHALLPPAGMPPAARVVIPYLPDAVISADGEFREPEWQKALGIAMDEAKVPAWHFFGSHVVEGRPANGEGANFWLLATKDGLALAAEIHKGQPEVVAEKSDWYGCDCLEIFTDVENKGGKPTKQIFLAYRRPNLDRAGASESDIQIGRVKLTDGYVLEVLIPWKAMGFAERPAGEFGLEFQVDYARPGAGRALQMTYGTGTNEAWINAAHFLKVKLGNP